MRPNAKFITPYLTQEFIKQEQARRRLKNKLVDINVERGNMVFLYGILGALVATITWILFRR